MAKILLSFLLTFVLLLPGCTSQQQIKLKVGVVEGLGEDIMQEVRKNAAKENFFFDIEVFKDYTEINTALKQRKIDINCFQNQLYLEKVNKERGTNFVSIGKTYLAPMGAYSKKHTQIKEKFSVAIADDSKSMARALLLLEKSGYIELQKNEQFLPELTDIIKNSYGLSIIPVNSSKIRESMENFDLVFLELNYARSINLHPSKALLIEDTGSNFTQLIVVLDSMQSNSEILKFVNFYNSQATKKFILENYNNDLLPAW